MGGFSLDIKNLRGLKAFHWDVPAGVSLLVGPNGVGKTTAVLALRLLRSALERGIADAVTINFGGSHGLEHHDAAPDEPIRIALGYRNIKWSMDLILRGSTVDYLTNERLTHRGRTTEVFKRDSLGNFWVGGERFEADERTGLRAVVDAPAADVRAVMMAGFVRKLTVFVDPDLPAVRGGSRTTAGKHLNSNGTNVLTMLRRWYQTRPERHRYQFVLDGLNAAFPNTVQDIDFVEAGNTIAARIYRPGREEPVSLHAEANGVLAMLVLLCDLAGAEPGGVVAIDEPENALHPFAIRAFLQCAEAWARAHDLSVILTSHSPVILDRFDDSPERVFVLKDPLGPGPQPVNELHPPDWLAQFRLGELQVDGELSSNANRS